MLIPLHIQIYGKSYIFIYFICRYFLTSDIMVTIRPETTSEVCRKCGELFANCLPIFWACPRIMKFWNYVFDFLNNIFKCSLAKNPENAILGVIPERFQNAYLLNILVCGKEMCYNTLIK